MKVNLLNTTQGINKGAIHYVSLSTCSSFIYHVIGRGRAWPTKSINQGNYKGAPHPWESRGAGGGGGSSSDILIVIKRWKQTHILVTRILFSCTIKVTPVRHFFFFLHNEVVHLSATSGQPVNSVQSSRSVFFLFKSFYRRHLSFRFSTSGCMTANANAEHKPGITRDWGGFVVCRVS